LDGSCPSALVRVLSMSIMSRFKAWLNKPHPYQKAMIEARWREARGLGELLPLAREIAADYGKALEQRPTYAVVIDSNMLPYSKNTIKQALTLLIAAENDLKLKEMMKCAFICIADWQDGVGRVPITVPRDVADTAGFERLAKFSQMISDENQKLNTIIENI